MWTPALVSERYLRDGLVLKIGRTEIGEGIVAGVVVVGVSADVGAKVEDRILIQRCLRVGGRDVECVDLRSLIGIADVAEDGIGACCRR